MTVPDYLSLLPKPLFADRSSQIRRIKNGYLPDLDDSVVQKAADSLGLDFLSVEGADNLCFIQSSEVQPAFRTSFNWRQLLHVLYAGHIKVFIESTHQPGLFLPSSAEEFWKLEAIGERLRQLHLLQFVLPPETFTLKEGSFHLTWHSSNPQIPENTRTLELGSNHCITGVPEKVLSFSLDNRIPAQIALEKLHPFSQENFLTYQKILFAIEQTLNLNKSLSPLKVHLLK